MRPVLERQMRPKKGAGAPPRKRAAKGFSEMGRGGG